LETDEETAGLSLFPEERELFPKPIVSPSIGIGKYPYDRDFKIIQYQVNVNVCPYLERIGGKGFCRIYERRPVACKSYPFTISRFEKMQPVFEMEGSCRANLTMNQNLRIFNEMESISETDAAIAEFRRMVSIMRVCGTIWNFDLREKEWIPSPRR
jgi:Fe-S-cluster containining protein